MKSINRLAILVTPREPFLAWARAIAVESEVVDDAADSLTTVYLVEVPDEFDPVQVIREHYPEIFVEQLNAWHRDESAWPRRRTEVVFRDWFEARVVDMVWDLGREPIEPDE